MKILVLAATLLVGCAARSETRTGYATVGPLRMYYEVQGQGRPLVLLHGGGSTAETSFGVLAPRLARTRRVIAVEQQGHGHTADVDRPFSFAQMADDTAALLQQIGVTEADVLGFSAGGVVAMELAIRHPRLVRRLILASSFYERAAFPPEFWQGFDHATLDGMPAVLREGYLKVAPRKEGLVAMFEKTVAMMKGFQDFPEATLRSMSRPVLVMVADHDVMSVESCARMARVFPHGELAVFPGSVHGTYLGAVEGGAHGTVLPDVAATLVDAFLSRP